MFGLTRYDPLFGELRTFDKLLNRFFREERSPLALWKEVGAGLDVPRIPSIDLIDEKDHFTVRAELPGLTKDEIDVTIKSGVLTLSGGTKKETTEEKKDYYSREISYGGFCRSIAIPEDIDTEKVSATLNNGVLELSLPKVKAAMPQHVKVEVGAGAK